MTSGPVPLPITTARLLAGVQSVSAAALVGLCAVFGATAYRSDRAAARDGSPNAFAGLGEAIAIFGAAVGLAVLLAIGIPTLRLGPGRSGARCALIVGECVIGGVPLVWAVGAAGVQLPTGVAGLLFAAHLALAAFVVAMLLTPAARAYAGRPAVSGPARAGCDGRGDQLA